MDIFNINIPFTAVDTQKLRNYISKRLIHLNPEEREPEIDKIVAELRYKGKDSE